MKHLISLTPLLLLLLCLLIPLAGAFAADKPEETPEVRIHKMTVLPPSPTPPAPPTTMTVTATAYCPCVICCGQWSAEHPNNAGTDFEQLTASGTVPEPRRTIAVDPDVIPLGSYVLIGKSVYVAEDTGSLIKGNRIDIYIPDHEEAKAFDVQELEIKVFPPERYVGKEISQ